MWTQSVNDEDSSLDWTFDEAPGAGEAGSLGVPTTRAGRAPTAHQPQPVRRRARWAWVPIFAIMALAVALNAVWPRVEAWRTRRAIEAVIARQEQAVSAGDQAGLRASFKSPAGSWADDQVARLESGWQPAAFGLPGARLAGQPGVIGSYQVLAPELVQADVARHYQLADGSLATFALPQYYQFVDGAWRQAPAPSTPAADLETITRGRVYVHYDSADASLADSTAGELDRLLARACADWSCPADLQVAVVFGTPNPTLAQHTLPLHALSDCLTFQMLAAGLVRLPDLVVKLPARAWAGYPVDAAADQAVQRSAAVQALANVADRLAGGAPGMEGPVRPFLYALIVRELVRLGMEPAGLSDERTIGSIVNAKQLWSVPALAPNSQPTLTGALAVLNRLLAGRSMADEQHLLQALDQASGPVAWLQTGLSLSPAQAQATWDSLLQSTP